MSEIQELVHKITAESKDREARLERIGKDLEAIIAICGPENIGPMAYIRNRAQKALQEVE